MTLIKSAGKIGKPFIVKELNYDFLNLKNCNIYGLVISTKTMICNDIKIFKFLKNHLYFTTIEFTTVNMRNIRKKMLNVDEIATEKL